MSKNRVKYQNSTKLWAMYTSTVLSIAFALFLLGLIVVGGYVSYKFSNQVKESIGFKVNLLSATPEDQALALRDTILTSEYVKSVEYISKDQAAKMFTEELGEDFVNFIGENPLYPTLVVNLKSQTIENNTGYIDSFIAEVAQSEHVTDVEYDKDIVGDLFGIFYKLGYVVLAFAILLLFISITLVSNTIRISIYSKRFSLRTMLLVGAKKRFIMRPFILRGMKYGFWGGVIAVGALFLMVYSIGERYPMILNLKTDLNIYIFIGVGLVLLGILISFFSTFSSVGKYIKMKEHELY